MKNDLEIVFEKYSTENLQYYPNSSVNSIFFQLYNESFDNEDILKKIIDDLLPLNLLIDDWLLYRLSKDLKINILEYLQIKGFDICTIDDKGENILFKIFEQTQFSFSESNIEKFWGLFEKLVKLGVNYEIVNNQGENLVHHVIKSCANEVLLAKVANLKIDINKQNIDGFTPLHFVAMQCTFYTSALINVLFTNGGSLSKNLTTKTYNYDNPDMPFLEDFTPFEIFEKEKETFTDYYMYEMEIIEKLKV